MGDQLTTNAEALRLFFTEDVYLLKDDASVFPVTAPVIQESVAQSAGIAAARVEAPPVIATPLVTAPVDVTPVIVQGATPIYKHLGKNQKHILILVNDEQHDVSTEQGRELLRNIVKAIGLTANDFALLNYQSTKGANFTELTQFFSSKVVFAFGLSATQLGLGEQPQNVIINQDNTQLIFSSNLDALAADLSGKKTLWGSLKKLNIT
jgi:hypothetical protein